MKSRIWDYVSAPAPRYILRLDVLQDLFDHYLPKSGFRFVEIGPGRGDVAAYVNSIAGPKGGVVIDFAEESIKYLSERFSATPTLQVYSGTVREVELANMFDVALAFEVLEHVPNDEEVLSDVAAKLRADGLLFISVPAYERKWQRQDDYAGHLRRYERSELSQKLRKAGFEPLEIVDYGFPLTSLLRPIRWFAYRQRPQGSAEELTKRSGMDRPFFENKPVTMSLFFYRPFLILQRFFKRSELGDGLILVARKV